MRGRSIPKILSGSKILQTKIQTFLITFWYLPKYKQNTNIFTKNFTNIFGFLPKYQNTNVYQNNVNVNDNVNDNVNERWYFHFVEVPTSVGLRPGGSFMG
jgi:hypothetical protein